MIRLMDKQEIIQKATAWAQSQDFHTLAKDSMEWALKTGVVSVETLDAIQENPEQMKAKLLQIMQMYAVAMVQAK